MPRQQQDRTVASYGLESLAPDGYGGFWVNQKRRLVHRLIYEHYNGAIPHSLQIDHLCRIRNCVNQEHLEAVTCRINIHRSIPYRRPGIETHCPKGHPYSGSNLRLRVEQNGYTHRECVECKRLRNIVSNNKNKPLRKFKNVKG